MKRKICRVGVENNNFSFRRSLFFFSVFGKITVGGFVNQLIKKFWPKVIFRKKCLLVVLRFNTLTAKVISWWSVRHICFLLFSHASAEVRGGNMLERKFPSTGDRTHNQVMSPTRSPLSHPDGAFISKS